MKNETVILSISLVLVQDRLTNETGLPAGIKP